MCTVVHVGYSIIGDNTKQLTIGNEERAERLCRQTEHLLIVWTGEKQT